MRDQRYLFSLHPSHTCGSSPSCLHQHCAPTWFLDVFGSGKIHVAILHLTYQPRSACHWIAPFIASYFHLSSSCYINIISTYLKKPLFCQKPMTLLQSLRKSELCITNICKTYHQYTSADGLAVFTQLFMCSNSWVLQKQRLQPACTQLRCFIGIWRGKEVRFK